MSNNYEGFRDSDRLTTWVRYMLYIQIVVAVVSIISNYLEYGLLSDFQNGLYISKKQAVIDGQTNDLRQGIVGIIYFMVFIIAGILILRWIHRANYNARQLGAENMRFTPGWSIGYYFIPVLSLWKPYRAMDEIWKASKNPSDWESQEAGGILPIWWTLWLISNFLGQAIFRLSMHAEEIQELINLNIITQISDILDIPLALVLLAIVNKISYMQKNQLSGASSQIQPVAISAG